MLGLVLVAPLMRLILELDDPIGRFLELVPQLRDFLAMLAPLRGPLGPELADHAKQRRNDASPN